LTLAAWAAAQEAPKVDPPKPVAEAKPNPEEAVIQKAVEQYIAAYNKGDAAALAKCWCETAEHINAATGERSTGRDAIEKNFAKMFAANGETELAVTVESIRFIRPDVAQINGQAVTITEGEEPSDSTFTAVLVKDKEQGWLLDSVNETVIPAQPKPADFLAELEFLIGHWVDDSEDVRVDTTVRWSPNRAFIVRSYTLEREDGVEHQGTQVIGWDPKNERIRCWMFDSDGSFGEGTWSKTDDGWMVKLARTLSDGRGASGTQVITKVDEDTLSVQTIGQEIDGEPSPATDPVRVVRVSSEE
jgi:uncharacterized protein (TIGR02246 family)